MSKYAIEDTTLTAIGNAIREKEGSTEPILVADFADRIAAITGGGDTPGGGSDIDLTKSIKEQMIDEVGEVWITRIHSYLDTVAYPNLYGAAVIEAYGQEGASVFPSGKFAIGTMPGCGLLNLNTLTDDGVAFNGSLVLTSGDYMEQVSPGVWRMIVWLYNNSNASTKNLFAGTYNWGDDVRIPYLCTNNTTSTASSESTYQIQVYNYTFGLDAECYEIRNMNYKYRHYLSLHGSKYMIVKYNPTTYDVQYSSPNLLKLPAYSYNSANYMSAKYIDVDGLCMGGDSSSYGKYAYFFAKSPQIKRVSFKNCRLYAYFTLTFYLYGSYADFSGVQWTHGNYDNTSPSNPIKFYMAKGEDWKERALYFAEHMPALMKTVKIDLPQFLDSAWGQENVVLPLINKGYTVTTTLSAAIE